MAGLAGGPEDVFAMVVSVSEVIHLCRLPNAARATDPTLAAIPREDALSALRPVGWKR
jgi:hypothetical protein